MRDLLWILTSCDLWNAGISPSSAAAASVYHVLLSITKSGATAGATPRHAGRHHQHPGSSARLASGT